MKMRSLLGVTAVALLSAGCASQSEIAMGRMCSDEACFQALRAWNEGRAPLPRQMTEGEPGELLEKQGIRPPTRSDRHKPNL